MQVPADSQSCNALTIWAFVEAGVIPNGTVAATAKPLTKPCEKKLAGPKAKVSSLNPWSRIPYTPTDQGYLAESDESNLISIESVSVLAVCLWTTASRDKESKSLSSPELTSLAPITVVSLLSPK